jgi:hypothetical protein
LHSLDTLICFPSDDCSETIHIETSLESTKE